MAVQTSRMEQEVHLRFRHRHWVEDKSETQSYIHTWSYLREIARDLRASSIEHVCDSRLSQALHLWTQGLFWVWERTHAHYLFYVILVVYVVWMGAPSNHTLPANFRHIGQDKPNSSVPSCRSVFRIFDPSVCLFVFHFHSFSPPQNWIAKKTKKLFYLAWHFLPWLAFFCSAVIKSSSSPNIPPMQLVCARLTPSQALALSLTTTTPLFKYSP